MENPKDLKRYAAGSLLAFALRESQIHQQCVQNFYLPSDDVPIDLPESELWINEKFGLLRPVFRYLKIDSKAWRGIEETALSSPALNHVGTFLKILSEEGKENSSSNIEEELIKAVDAMAATLESKMSSHLPPQSSESCGVSKRKRAQTNNHISGASDGTGRGCQSISAGLKSGSEHTFHQQKMIKERKLLTEGRRKLVLFELLTACVVDTPEDDRKPTMLRRGYDARHRVALRFLAKVFGINWTKVVAMEIMLACSTMAKLQERVVEENGSNSQEDKWSKWKHGGMIGAAALTGGTLLAISGGLAAPAIAQGLIALAPTLGAIVPVVSASGFTAFVAATTQSVVGSIAIAASFGAAGANLYGTKMARRIGGVEGFQFIPIGRNHKQGRLAVAIMISGSISKFDDFTSPWIEVDKDLERYALCWEPETLIELSTVIEKFLTSSIKAEIIKQGTMLTVLHTLLDAMAWPKTLLGATYLIDNVWSMAVDRSDKAGVLLAQSLLESMHRPVTLVGFSFGARVIFRCLEELSKKCEGASIVERVVLLGAPIPLDMERWKTARKMVAGRFVNCYSTNDWILGIVYRATLFTQGLAGIQPVKIRGIENVDVTSRVEGHTAYPFEVSRILKELDLDNFFPVVPSL